MGGYRPTGVLAGGSLAALQGKEVPASSRGGRLCARETGGPDLGIKTGFLGTGRQPGGGGQHRVWCPGGLTVGSQGTLQEMAGGGLTRGLGIP